MPQTSEKSLLTYQIFSFGISPRILAYQPGFWHIKYVWSTFGVSVRILAYQSIILYHLPLLTGWELQYRIQGCFHPVHVHFPVFLEQSLPFTSSTTRPVNLGVVCLPARATGVVTRPPSSWRCCQRDAPSFFVSGCAATTQHPPTRECARVARAAHVGPPMCAVQCSQIRV